VLQLEHDGVVGYSGIDWHPPQPLYHSARGAEIA
jgi:hypothetical protein